MSAVRVRPMAVGRPVVAVETGMAGHGSCWIASLAEAYPLRGWRASLTGADQAGFQSFVRRSRSAFPITDTDERLIAALAIIGERSSRSHG